MTGNWRKIFISVLTVIVGCFIGVESTNDRHRNLEVPETDVWSSSSEVDQTVERKGKKGWILPVSTNPAADSLDEQTISPSEAAKVSVPLHKEVKEPLQGMFEIKLDAEVRDGNVEFRFSLANISNEDLRITHGSGQQYDVSVYNEHDEEIYRWSYGRAFTLALIERELGAGEQLTFQDTWPLLDNEGNSVPAGTYTVKVQVMATLSSGTIHPDELVANTVIVVR